MKRTTCPSCFGAGSKGVGMMHHMCIRCFGTGHIETEDADDDDVKQRP